MEMLSTFTMHIGMLYVQHCCHVYIRHWIGDRYTRNINRLLHFLFFIFDEYRLLHLSQGHINTKVHNLSR